jgi:hypothetical protein
MNSRRSRHHRVDHLFVPLIRMRGTLLKTIEWLRAGYPDNAPRTGYSPLIALQGPASLTDHQIRRITNAVTDHPGDPTKTDIEATILEVTDRLPHPGQVAQVQRYLRH